MEGSEWPGRSGALRLAYLQGGEMVTQPGEVLGPRSLADFELVYLIEGGVVYESDGISFSVPAGGFILGRPGLQETYRWDGQIPTRHAFFHFGIEALPREWPDPADWPRVQVVLEPVCAHLFRHIIQRIYAHKDWPSTAPDHADCRPVELLMDLFLAGSRLSEFSFAPDRPEPVRRALRFIRHLVEEDPARSITLADIAGQGHVSEKHLCRLFSSHLGCSPMQVFLLLKLQSARPLLVRTNLSVKEVANRCGFDNPLYFSRRFSMQYGCSPANFRKQVRTGAHPMPKRELPVDLIPRTHW